MCVCVGKTTAIKTCLSIKRMLGFYDPPPPFVFAHLKHGFASSTLDFLLGTPYCLDKSHWL